MVKKIVIRSNGDALLVDEDKSTEVVCMLDKLVVKLLTDKRINGETEIYTPLNSAPTKVNQWFDLKPVE